MLEQFAAFHFLRPLLLLALLPVALIWWRVRPHRNGRDDIPAGIAPHLARALTVGRWAGRKVYPIDGVSLILGLLVLASAGPTWSRVDNPLLAQTAPLVVALKVTPSMENNDVQPTRHKRASFKILDLVERRGGAQTALFAYAGTAHRVTPLTEDPNILRSYMSGLEPSVMPRQGDRADQALQLSLEELDRSDTPGAILFVFDDMNPANVAAFQRNAENRAPVIFFVVNGQNAPLSQLSGIPNSSIVELTPDDSDLDQIEQRVLSAFRAALLEDERQDWEDKGWIFAWPALLLFLPWFRRGWTMRWALVAIMIGGIGNEAQADGWQDWFLTPDQQGQLAFNDKRWSEAADLFQNSEWRAYALLRSGRYEEAAEAFSFIETSKAAEAQGIALLRSRKYRAGIRAFELAIERDADNETAAQNLETARAIVAYVEAEQLAGDTGESGIGADDIVFDNESGQGADTQIEREVAADTPVGLSTEDWMRAVDTQVGDFLATRFRLEDVRGDNQ